MADHSGMKLGKRPRRDERRLRSLWRYMGATAPGGPALPPVPANCERGGAVASWPMLDNDTIGDCTIAAVGHAVQLWTAVAERMRVMSNAEALAGYEAFGYRPGEPSSDRGVNAVDVLTRWNGAGLACGGAADMLSGFCTIDPAEQDEVRAGVAWLGVVYAGIELPIAAQQMDLWDAPAAAAALVGNYEPGSWGGHAVPIVGYGPGGVTCVTWGALKQITWRFWAAYASEAYGLLSRDFVTGGGRAASVDWGQLEADMAGLRREAA